MTSNSTGNGGLDIAQYFDFPRHDPKMSSFSGSAGTSFTTGGL